MDKQKLIECAELLDDIAGNLTYNHRLNSGVVNLLRHSVDSNGGYGFEVVDAWDIDSCFSIVNNYNETIKQHLEELSDAIGKVYKLAFGDEMSGDSDWDSPEGDEHGEVPMALQDAGRIEITSNPLEEDYFTGRTTTGTIVTIRSKEDDK
jgi:hypothetical protein